MHQNGILLGLALLALGDQVRGHFSMYDTLLGQGSQLPLGARLRPFSRPSPRQSHFHQQGALDLLSYIGSPRRSRHDLVVDPLSMSSPHSAFDTSLLPSQHSFLDQLALRLLAGGRHADGQMIPSALGGHGRYVSNSALDTTQLDPSRTLGNLGLGQPTIGGGVAISFQNLQPAAPTAAHLPPQQRQMQLDTLMMNPAIFRNKRCGASRPAITPPSVLSTNLDMESLFTCRCRRHATEVEATRIDNSLKARLECRTEITNMLCCLAN